MEKYSKAQLAVIAECEKLVDDCVPSTAEETISKIESLLIKYEIPLRNPDFYNRIYDMLMRFGSFEQAAEFAKKHNL
ncbi:MAG: hypothetical protein HY883_01560 [Deltaproteobacteria bacterium]|nr:hypothetical protein [Deltaproteobacteria bacterium]